jgi:hypothetical protein
MLQAEAKRIRPRLLPLACVIALVALAAAAAMAQDASTSLETLCKEWGANLADREHHNLEQINWQFSTTGVEGDYVGYTPIRSCSLLETSGPTPVGQINYLEIQYEKHGWTVAEAESSQPVAVATTDVTEIFRFDDGKWLY